MIKWLEIPRSVEIFTRYCLCRGFPEFRFRAAITINSLHISHHKSYHLSFNSTRMTDDNWWKFLSKIELKSNSSMDFRSLFFRNDFVTYLLDHAISNARQVLLVEVHQHDASLEASSQVQQRVEWQWSDMRRSPTIGAFFDVLLVFDPASCFLPLALLTSSMQLVELNKDFMGTSVDGGSLTDTYDILLILFTFNFGLCRAADLATSHSSGIFASVRIQVVHVSLLEMCIFRLGGDFLRIDFRLIFRMIFLKRRFSRLVVELTSEMKWKIEKISLSDYMYGLSMCQIELLSSSCSIVFALFSISVRFRLVE